MSASWDNLTIWLIIALALVAYGLLLDLLLQPASEQWQRRTSHWLQALNPMLAALPLLGLLGTITGLLQTFSVMARGPLEQQELLTGGIADALNTTELGLLLVVPGWILMGSLHRRSRRYAHAEATAP